MSNDFLKHIYARVVQLNAVFENKNLFRNLQLHTCISIVWPRFVLASLVYGV